MTQTHNNGRLDELNEAGKDRPELAYYLATEGLGTKECLAALRALDAYESEHGVDE